MSAERAEFVCFVAPVEIPTMGFVDRVIARDGLPISVDYEAAVVKIGPSGFEVPFTRCVSWKVLRLGKGVRAPTFICPECQKQCEDARGLGAHRFQKHGIRSQQKAAVEEERLEPVSTLGPVERDEVLGDES